MCEEVAAWALRVRLTGWGGKQDGFSGGHSAVRIDGGSNHRGNWGVHHGLLLALLRVLMADSGGKEL